MKTYRLEVYGHFGKISAHLWGRENLTLTEVLREIEQLDKETYRIVEEAAE